MIREDWFYVYQLVQTCQCVFIGYAIVQVRQSCCCSCTRVSSIALLRLVVMRLLIANMKLTITIAGNRYLCVYLHISYSGASEQGGRLQRLGFVSKCISLLLTIILMANCCAVVSSGKLKVLSPFSSTYTCVAGSKSGSTPLLCNHCVRFWISSSMILLFSLHSSLKAIR